jgi:hypothetical protein
MGAFRSRRFCSVNHAETVLLQYGRSSNKLSGVSMRLGMMAPEPSSSPVLPCHRVQFWQSENGWRLDRSYRGCRRRVIPRMVDAARFRSLIDEFPSPS